MSKDLTDSYTSSSKMVEAQGNTPHPKTNKKYTSAEVTPNGGDLVRESHQNAVNSGVGIIVICPDISMDSPFCVFVDGD